MSGGRGLAGSASRGAVVTLVGQAVRVVVQLAGIVVLARLLSPEDYGLVAIVAAIIGFGEIFRDFGLSSAAIQARVLTDGQRDNLFWLNTGIGGVLAVLVCAAAPLLAAAFDDDRLVPLAMALSATFLLNGISTQYRAMHARHLRFGRLALSEITGQLAGVALGITAAALGAGYWALVVLQLGQLVVTQVLLVATNRWLPGRPRRDESIRPFVGYGAQLIGAQLLNHLASNVDTLTIGARFGAVPAGLYNRAFQLVMMPLLQVQMPSTRVALPVLSRLQDQRERFADFLLFGQVVLLSLIGTVFGVLVAQAPDVVHLALGPQWPEVVPLLRILLVAGFFQAAGYATYWVFLAKGLTRTQFVYALVTRPVVAAMVVAGSVWGLRGVAVAYAAGAALSWPTALLWIRRASDAPVGRMFGNGLRALVVFGTASAVSWLSTRELPADAHVLRLLVGALVLVAVAGLLVLLWPAYRRDARRMWSLREHLGRRRGRHGRPARGEARGRHAAGAAPTSTREAGGPLASAGAVAGSGRPDREAGA
ncbi:lipopolysaccharide biosynthesis protein [Modestobacter versicolor]|uniref:PST family polysaccharide transporter n=1 Tax=Modestobacter versicolor TaxID=429133 RepID=A0A839Y181_9ACTN|nr:lipopolysaccharide biosynthesis protein [Modestobacter versicolor]MBB3676978.1 PST family polysaccharide transporter [Modestobacter versicolor]